MGREDAAVACDLDCCVPWRTTALDVDAMGVLRNAGATKATRICLDANMVEGIKEDGRSGRLWGLIEFHFLKTHEIETRPSLFRETFYHKKQKWGRIREFGKKCTRDPSDGCCY